MHSRGLLFGIAIGDALGVPVEFMSRKHLQTNPVVGMREFGTHHQPIGTWSDDTAMSFLLVEQLIEGYDINGQFLFRSYQPNYFFRQLQNKVPDLFYAFPFAGLACNSFLFFVKGRARHSHLKIL